jgi:trk system potassium uptake protein TrkH
MRLHYTLYVVGALMVAVGLTMFFALGFSLYYDDAGVMPLAKSIAVSLTVGGAMYLLFRKAEAQPMNHREGMAIVALGWIAAGIIGALPFLFAGTFGSTDAACITDSIFESVSGFTTTGSSVLTDIEAVPKGLLMWRSLTHWLGGMGIIVLSLAILPFLGVGGMQLYKAEVPGPVPDKLKPRIKDTAMLLWKVYLLFTLAQTALLIIGGMSIFDALCHTFGTVATGGFSTKNTSVAHYDSAYIDTVITIFMLLAGINFSLHFHLLRGKPRIMLKDPEFKFFMGVFLVFTAIVTISTLGVNYDSIWSALRYAAFQVAGILTTTGFATADYELWPSMPQALLVFLMFMGGCAGSTAGGMKCMRIILLMKRSYLELFRLIHPHAVSKVKLEGKTVETEIMAGVIGFCVLFLGLFIVSSFIMAGLGLDVVTAFSSVAACIGNIGPGLGAVGPTDNFAHIPTAGKWVLIFCMLLGRLEIYTIIILFVPEFWRK